MQNNGMVELEYGHGVPPHLAVWLDHKQARLIWLYHDRAVETVVHCVDPGAHGNVHHHSGTPAGGHAPVQKHFLEKISEAIGAAAEILILGPVEARSALRTFLQTHRPQQASHVLDDEAMAHAETSQIAGHARKFFRRADRMSGRRL